MTGSRTFSDPVAIEFEWLSILNTSRRTPRPWQVNKDFGIMLCHSPIEIYYSGLQMTRAILISPLGATTDVSSNENLILTEEDLSWKSFCCSLSDKGCIFQYHIPFENWKGLQLILDDESSGVNVIVLVLVNPKVSMKVTDMFLIV